MVNADVFKTTIEDDLKEIAKCKLDILILQRQNETLCKTNNEEIKKITEAIENRELSLEENLSKSGEKKIECKLGWCAYRVMPDSWEYDEPVILAWCKQRLLHSYYRTIEVVEKMKIKKAILDGDIKLEDVQVEDNTIEYQSKIVQGIKVTPQAPKFNYKLSGGL